MQKHRPWRLYYQPSATALTDSEREATIFPNFITKILFSIFSLHKKKYLRKRKRETVIDGGGRDGG